MMQASEAKLDALPAGALGQPGRDLLADLLRLNTGWDVDFEEIGGDWFLVEKARNGLASLTPIEVFDLEEAHVLF